MWALLIALSPILVLNVESSPKSPNFVSRDKLYCFEGEHERYHRTIGWSTPSHNLQANPCFPANEASIPLCFIQNKTISRDIGKIDLGCHAGPPITGEHREIAEFTMTEAVDSEVVTYYCDYSYCNSVQNLVSAVKAQREFEEKIRLLEVGKEDTVKAMRNIDERAKMLEEKLNEMLVSQSNSSSSLEQELQRLDDDGAKLVLLGIIIFLIFVIIAMLLHAYRTINLPKKQRRANNQDDAIELETLRGRDSKTEGR